MQRSKHKKRRRNSLNPPTSTLQTPQMSRLLPPLTSIPTVKQWSMQVMHANLNLSLGETLCSRTTDSYPSAKAVRIPKGTRTGCTKKGADRITERGCGGTTQGPQGHGQSKAPYQRWKPQAWSTEYCSAEPYPEIGQPR